MIADRAAPEDTPLLTPEDLDLPGEDDLITDDGEPMESNRHRLQMNLLIDTLNHHWRDRDDVFVGGNMFIYFSLSQVKNNDFRGPDFFTVLGTRWRDRKAWVVWEEDGKYPDVVIELLSSTTAAVDRGEKKDIYEQVLRVPEYYLFDPYTAEFEGYRLVGGRYQAIEPDEGLWTSERLGLNLGLWEGVQNRVQMIWLRWYTLDGELILTSSEWEEARAESEAARAESEAARAEDAENRAKHLEETLAAYRERFGEMK